MPEAVKQEKYYDTLPPDAISSELAPVIEELGLDENCRQFAMEGWTVVVAIECPAGSVPMWDGNLWHSNYPRETEGERVVCHITYTRLMMRPVEDYAGIADELIEKYGEPMAQMLGKTDFLCGPNGAEYDKLITTFNNAKR